MQVSFINYSMIRQLNSSAVPTVSLLDVVRPNISITPDMVHGIVSVTYLQPNESLGMVFMSRSAFAEFGGVVARYYGGNLTGSTSLFFVDVNNSGNITRGWLALVPSDNMVAFAVGFSAAKQVIVSSLDASNGTIANALQRTDLRQALYIVDGITGHVSLGIQNFPGVVRTGEMTTIAVDDVSNTTQVSYVVKFQDSNTAVSQLSYMKSVYGSARVYSQYDQYLKGIEYQPFSQLEGAARLVG